MTSFLAGVLAGFIPGLILIGVLTAALAWWIRRPVKLPAGGEDPAASPPTAPDSPLPGSPTTPRGRVARRIKLPDGTLVDFHDCRCVATWAPPGWRIVTYPCREHEIEHWNWRLANS